MTLTPEKLPFDTSERVAELLVSCGAVKVDFEEGILWTSGLKSPIYCDCREIIGHTAVREEIIYAMLQQILRLPDQPHAVSGTATAGIPWGAWIADKMRLPFLFVRKKPKGHGAKKQVEGCTRDHCERILLIEDAISTAGSAMNAVEALRREKKATVPHVMSIFSWDTKIAKENQEKYGVQIHYLTKFEHIVTALVKIRGISPDQAQKLHDFHASL